MRWKGAFSLIAWREEGNVRIETNDTQKRLQRSCLCMKFQSSGHQTLPLLKKACVWQRWEFRCSTIETWWVVPIKHNSRISKSYLGHVVKIYLGSYSCSKNSSSRKLAACAWLTNCFWYHHLSQTNTNCLRAEQPEKWRRVCMSKVHML